MRLINCTHTWSAHSILSPTQLIAILQRNTSRDWQSVFCTPPETRANTWHVFSRPRCLSLSIAVPPRLWQFCAAEPSDFLGSHKGSVGIRAGSCADFQKFGSKLGASAVISEGSLHNYVWWRNEYLALKIPLGSQPRSPVSHTFI